MQKIIEIEGRLVKVESKWIEINGNQVETVGNIYLVKSDSDDTPQSNSTTAKNEPESSAYVSGSLRITQHSDDLMTCDGHR